jgi:hypothetical protein
MFATFQFGMFPSSKPQDLNIQNYNFTVVLYGDGTWTLTRVRMFESQVFRRIFGPKRVKVTGR